MNSTVDLTNDHTLVTIKVVIASCCGCTPTGDAVIQPQASKQTVAANPHRTARNETYLFQRHLLHFSQHTTTNRRIHLPLLALSFYRLSSLTHPRLARPFNRRRRAQMAPPTSLFSASELPDRIQLNAEGKRRKPVDPGISSSSSSATGRIDLSACELLEMMQWSCTVEGDGPADRPVTCFPVQRYFRR